jgi:hypothetical protein
MDIRLLKLVSGDDIISAVEETADTFILHNPTRIVATREGIGLAPMNPFLASKQFEISKSHVVYTGELEDEVRNGYNTQFGSGIVMAPASALRLVGVED